MRNLLIPLALGAALALAITGLPACGSSGSGGCAEDEVEVDYIRGARDGDVHCAARPAACPNPAACDDDQCRGSMYGLCDPGYIGVGCSDTFAPPIISCNPDN
ncbi:MAG TPA: hypothetical protein VGM90_37610 [Kofleriaceae bacterium]